jgi:hypothetical protein
MNPMTRKRPASYPQDRAWCSKHLARGTPVWCVRAKDTGLVVSFVAKDIRGWTQFEGLAVEEYTVQQMVMRDGLAFFGPESAWPREVER